MPNHRKYFANSLSKLTSTRMIVFAVSTINKIFIDLQGRPSRGFRGVTCTPAFLPSPGNSYIPSKKKICTCFFIFPEIPRLVHPCYLGWISLGTYYLHAGAGIT